MSRRTSNNKRKFGLGAIIAIVAAVALGIFVFFTLIIPAQKARARQKNFTALAKATFDAAKTQNLVGIEKNIGNLQTELRALQKDVKPMAVYQALPFFGYVFSDLQNGLSAGDYLLTAGKQTVTALEPYADLIGLKKGSSFANQSTEDRLQTAILTIDKLGPQIDEISVNLEKAKTYLDKIDPNKYPEKIGKTVVRERIKNYYDQISGIVALATDAKPLFKQLPKMLGKDKEMKYLVLFMNDGELRPTGGFITAYAIFTVDKGKIRVQESTDIYDLDKTIQHPAAPAEILRYHKGVNQFYIRDSNLSPDFVESNKLFEKLLAKSSKNISYDGIIAIDTEVLVNTLKILGPTTAGDVTFNGEPDDRCWGCPQVIYELENLITRPTPYFRQERKSMLSVLLYTIMQKSLGVSPSKYWGSLAQNFIKELDEKHIQVNMKDTDSQKALELLNYAGRIREFSGDYLHINNTNYAGAKSNLFVDYTLKSTAKKEGETLKREVIMEYKNLKPASDCNLERGNLCLNAPLRNWVRVYVPKGAKLVSFVGSEMPVRQYEELGKQVFEGFLVINPMGKAEIRVTYEMPASFIKNNVYRLLYQKQAGVSSIDATISYNGKTVKDVIRKDTIFTIK